MVRKGTEYALTPAADLLLPKERLLELYLNEIVWGPGIYGIEAAARHHYDRPASKLTRDQAASLAAVTPAPRTRRPERTGSHASVIGAWMKTMRR